MIKYKSIARIKYKNKYYQMFIDGEKKLYFLKVDKNDNYSYITLNELIELTNVFSKNPSVLLIGNEKKMVPKILMKGIPITLSLSMLTLVGCKDPNTKNKDLYRNTISSETTVKEIEPTTDAEAYKAAAQKAINQMLEDIKMDKEDFVIEKSKDLEGIMIIYDFSELDKIFDYPKESITYDTIRKTISDNKDISKKYKDLYITLANNLEDQYPTMDLRVWHKALSDLKIIECSKEEMQVKAESDEAYACYRLDDNVIYTLKDYDYKPGTWEYQIIIHEMCHPIRSARFKKDNTLYTFRFDNSSGYGNIIGESLNSLLSLRSYDKTGKVIAYQLQSNMMETIISCMNNYSYQDFVEHNISYLEDKLNKQNRNDLAVDMMALMELQFTDKHDDSFEIEEKEFYRLYDYISDMYYKKHITDDMNYNEARNIKDELVKRLNSHVKKEKRINEDHFDQYFEKYAVKNGISSGKTK